MLVLPAARPTSSSASWDSWGRPQLRALRSRQASALHLTCLPTHPPRCPRRVVYRSPAALQPLKGLMSTMTAKRSPSRGHNTQRETSRRCEGIWGSCGLGSSREAAAQGPRQAARDSTPEVLGGSAGWHPPAASPWQATCQIEGKSDCAARGQSHDLAPISLGCKRPRQSPTKEG